VLHWDLTLLPTGGLPGAPFVAGAVEPEVHSGHHNARYYLNRSSLGTDWSIVMTSGSVMEELYYVRSFSSLGGRERYSLLYDL